MKNDFACQKDSGTHFQNLLWGSRGWPVLRQPNNILYEIRELQNTIKMLVIEKN